MNKVQERFRIISDAHVDDTAVEMRACERAALAKAITERALADGILTTSEALEILVATRATLADCEDSLSRNVAVQRSLDAMIATLADLPANAIARIPSPTQPLAA
jgi:hypothetical protein